MRTLLKLVSAITYGWERNRGFGVALAMRHRLRPMSHLHFYRATLSRDKIASVTWRVAQLLNSRATSFLIRAALYSVQLCRENAVNADWSIIVYAAKLHCATRHFTLAILSRDKVAR